jgi:hypothetical protein
MTLKENSDTPAEVSAEDLATIQSRKGVGGLCEAFWKVREATLIETTGTGGLYTTDTVHSSDICQSFTSYTVVVITSRKSIASAR